MKSWVGGKCKNCGKAAGLMVKCDTCGTVGCARCIGDTNSKGIKKRCNACGDTQAFIHYVN